MTTTTLTSLAAGALYGVLEGSAYVYTTGGFKAFLLVEHALFACSQGVRRTAGTAARALVLTSMARGCYAFWLALRHRPEALDSIWQWQPPGSIVDSGAWGILRRLVITLQRVQRDNPCVPQLLEGARAIGPDDLAMRLYCTYLRDSNTLAQGPAESDEILSSSELSALRHACDLAGLMYFVDSEGGLAEQLQERGYSLCGSKFAPDWGLNHPAYYVAVHEEEREAVISIRGTHQLNDVFVDVLAAGKEFDGTGRCVHAGICDAATWLGGRIGAIAAALEKQGYRIAIVGHSLGAGVAALLGLYLTRRGLTNLHCYAFETPACVPLELATDCSDYVTSMVFADDLVPRMSLEMFAALLQELRGCDWQQMVQDHGLVDAAKSSVLKQVTRLGLASATGEAERQQSKGGGSAGCPGQEEEFKGYNPHVPGRVVHMCRFGDTDQPSFQGIVVKPDDPRIRQIRLSATALEDHMIDSKDYVRALHGEG